PEPVEILDHHCARVAELVGPLDNPDAGRAQVREHRLEIRIGQRDMIDDHSARACERLVVPGSAAAVAALPRVPGPGAVREPHVADGNAQLSLRYEARISD